MWDENFDDEYDQGEEDAEEDWENVCECGRPGVSNCDCCGAPLCVVCAECGANFCDTCMKDPHMSEKMERLYAEQSHEPDAKKAT